MLQLRINNKLCKELLESTIIFLNYKLNNCFIEIVAVLILLIKYFMYSMMDINCDILYACLVKALLYLGSTY